VYEVSGNGFSSTGIITPDALGNATIPGFSTGAYAVKLSQDQLAIGGCSLEESEFKDAPLAALDIDTIRVPNPRDKFEKSLPEYGTASRTIRIQESGKGPYELLLELTEAYGFQDPNPIKGWFEIQNREITIDNLYAGVYTVSLRDQVSIDGSFGCLKTYTMIIPLDESIWIPNIITPNNDGWNDSFFIRNLPPEGSKLIVNDRWGKQIYSSNDYRSYYVVKGTENIPVGDWTGEGAEPGVYYYRLQVEGGKVYTGWVEVQPGN
jgi:hypothetical protein